MMMTKWIRNQPDILHDILGSYEPPDEMQILRRDDALKLIDASDEIIGPVRVGAFDLPIRIDKEEAKRAIKKTATLARIYVRPTIVDKKIILILG